MKNLYKQLGIIALTAVIVFTMAACGGDDDGGGGGGGGASTFTLTGIPSKYNGMYAFFGAYSPSLGYVSNILNWPVISNGKVSVTGLCTTTTTGAVDYTGNETCTGGRFVIYGTESLSDAKALLEFNSVKFSNGSASRAWSEADDILEVPF